MMDTLGQTLYEDEDYCYDDVKNDLADPERIRAAGSAS